MDIYVLNSDFQRTDIIEDYESCIWNNKYFDVGDFELYVHASCEYMRLLQRGNYLVRDKDVVAGCMYNVMSIDSIDIKTDVENGDHIIVTGKDLKSIAGRRIIWTQTNLNGLVEVELRRLITENIINPSISARAIPNTSLAELHNFTDTITQQVTGDNLQEYISGVCKTYGIGWECGINVNGEICFNFFKGVDRSIDQNDRPHVVFSPANENILNSDYKLDYSEYKNVALVAGEGEGTARRTTTVGTCSGINRYEIYVDSRDVSSNEGEISDTDYLNMLALNGSEALEEARYAESFEGEIEPHDMYIYGTDYNLGDLVTVTTVYEVTANPRIIGVIESMSNEGESIVPTFSTWIGDDE